jgi:anaerobic selenocysteine-containing dehydrogenase
LKGGIYMAATKEYDSIHRTTVWSAGPGCHGGCGVKLFVKDGKVVKVEGDENHPWNQGKTCPRVLALTQYMYHPDRVTTPLKRVGERGEGKWQKISWDEAYDIVVKRLTEIGEKYGRKSVIFCQGTGRDIGGPMSLMAYSYGSPNWGQIGLSGQSCYTPRLAAMLATFGDYAVVDAGQFFEKRFNDPQWKAPKCLIIWGHNLPSSCPDGFFSQAWLMEIKKRGAKIIVIDPRVSWSASKADYHLRVRSGTDGALALGMLHIIINEGLYDKEFVEKWTYGFDELKKRVQEYTPEKVSEITWIPKEQIINAARLYAASKPATIQWGVPVDMNPQGDVVAQAISQLWCITGNLDVPGGNVIARSSHGVTVYPMSTDQLVALYGEEFIKMVLKEKIGAAEYPMVRDYRHWVQPDLALKQMLTDKPYPIKAAWIQTTNILGGQAADTRGHYDALKRMEFVVVVDLFQNPTSMAAADLFLPAATFAEKDSARAWWAPLSVTPKAVQVGECKNDWEISFELAKRFNPKVVPWKDVMDMFNSRLKPAGLTFEDMVARGTWAMPPEGPSRPYRRYEKGLLRVDKKAGFNTPTGKVELYSKRLEGWGLDPLPYFEEPPESPVRTPDLWKEYPLIMGTGRRSPVFFHAEHRMIPWLRKLDPYPIVEIHPEVAKKLGIDDGEWVYVENKRGRIKRKAKVTPVVPTWMVMVPHGWWLPETDGREPNLFGLWDYNCNQLVPAGCQSKSGYGGGPYKTMLCRVTKIKEGGK